jgi:hypothetical protein
MKNIAFSADEDLIEKARAAARARHETLNVAFRQWLEQLATQPGNGAEYDSLMQRLQHVEAGRRLIRDEMNER